MYTTGHTEKLIKRYIHISLYIKIKMSGCVGMYVYKLASGNLQNGLNDFCMHVSQSCSHAVLFCMHVSPVLKSTIGGINFESDLR